MAMALINTLLQTVVSDNMRGRVMSLFMFTFAGLMPFGSLLSGALSQWIGVSRTVLLCGIICFSFFAVINTLLPKLRDI
jgi:MFS family permease